MHVTLVEVHVIPEFREDFIAASRLNHEASVREPGNLRFDILQSPQDPNHFFFYEAYRSEQEALAHKQTPHYQSWRATVADWMASPRQGTPMLGLFPQTR